MKRNAKMLGWLALLTLACASLSAQGVFPSLEWQSELVEGQKNRGWKVRHLTDSDLNAIDQIGLESEAGQELLVVFGGDSKTPLIGKVFLRERVLYFEPRFQPSLGGERAEFHIERIRDGVGEPIAAAFHNMGGSYASSVPRLTNVFPTQTRVPQNVLRMYLQFDMAMKQGDCYRYIEFFNEAGKAIDPPFLEIPEELWSSDGTRLTLLFDPGRIKRGLDRHRQAGPPFEVGKQYTLVVSDQWPVPATHPRRRGKLRNKFIHRFTITEPDRVQPSVERWQIKLPPSDSREPLHVRFDEPLDNGMLQHSLEVFTEKNGLALTGEVRVSKNGQDWWFVPDQPWRAGRFNIVANPKLEDLAGNSLAQPFERNIEEGKTEPAALPEPNTTLPFEIDEMSPKKPNVVFILADDLGYHDLSCTGSKLYESPNIDRICHEGIRFTQGYAACQVCSPSRAAIMTGKAPARLQITEYIGAPSGANWKRNTKLLPPSYKRSLPEEETTIAEAFHEAGYQTFFAGKWHLGSEGSFPEDHGFDVNVGGHRSGSPPGGFFVPYRNPKMADGPAGECLPERLGEETASFIESNKDKPFFAFLSFYSVHAPIQTSEELWKKYRAKAEADDALSNIENRFIIDRTMPVRQVQDHPIYAGMVESMDNGVGKVLETLDRLGLAENTIVVFTSDNGGVSSGDGYATSNLPLRGGKGRQWEGGIREPFFVRWPNKIMAGSSDDTPVIGTDLYPTLLDLCGLPGRPRQTLDGVNLRPILDGEFIAPRNLIWHYPHYGNQGGEPCSILRNGKWKLIRYHEDDREELYDLEEDPSEQTDLLGENLSIKNKARADQMSGELAATLLKMEARKPKRNPNFDVQAYVEWQSNMRENRLPNLERSHARFREADFKPKNGWWDQY